MFDKYHIHQRPSHTSVHVEEKRAPTDASVRLLREMETEAMNRVLHQGQIRNNIIEGDWYIIQEFAFDKVTAKCRFVINGKDFSMEVPIEDYRFKSREELAQSIFKCITNSVSLFLADELFKSGDIQVALGK